MPLTKMYRETGHLNCSFPVLLNQLLYQQRLGNPTGPGGSTWGSLRCTALLIGPPPGTKHYCKEGELHWRGGMVLKRWPSDSVSSSVSQPSDQYPGHTWATSKTAVCHQRETPGVAEGRSLHLSCWQTLSLVPGTCLHSGGLGPNKPILTCLST